MAINITCQTRTQLFSPSPIYPGNRIYVIHQESSKFWEIKRGHVCACTWHIQGIMHKVHTQLSNSSWTFLTRVKSSFLWIAKYILVYCNTMNFMQFIIYLDFTLNMLRFNGHWRRAWIKKVRCSLRQIIRHRVIKGDITSENYAIMNHWGLIQRWVRRIAHSESDIKTGKC